MRATDVHANIHIKTRKMTAQTVSSGGLAVKHSALGVNGRRFEPRKRSKLFQGLISRLTTSWVADHVKWRCRLH